MLDGAADLESLAGTLEASGNYRVLRRLPERTTVTEPDGSEQHLGLVLDVETTGLDPKRDEIIELAMVPFSFSGDGRIFNVGPAFAALSQPSIPIPPEITELTGITDEMVAGRAINAAEVVEIAEGAVLIVAHHAEFDRPFVERFHPVFRAKCWACSMSQIDWQVEGLRSVRLASLLTDLGFFYERHRAVSDCMALVELLAQPLPRSGVTGLAALLERAREPTWRIWAERAPFEAKDILKARGYRWNPGDDGRPKAWFFDARPGKSSAEIEFLRREIYRSGVTPRVDKLTAYERFRAEGC